VTVAELPPPVHHGAELDRAQAVAVLVHGRDQDRHVMLDLARRVDLPWVGYLVPEAPAGSWYPGRYFDPVEDNEPWLSQALRIVEATIAQARAHSDAPLVLAGFSQGACLVAERLARSGAVPLAGAGILTGALLGDLAQRPCLDVALDALPVPIVSSLRDSWIDPEPVRTTAAILRAAGADVRLTLTDEPEHHIDDVAVAAVRRLLEEARLGV